MKRFAIIMLAVGLLVLPLTSFAQLFGDPSDDRYHRSDWDVHHHRTLGVSS